MKLILSSLIIFLVTFECTAQAKISFLNSDFNPSSEKRAVYRMEEKELGDTVFKTVYLKKYPRIILEVKHPKSNYDLKYQKQFDEWGKPTTEGWFYNKKKVGEWRYYSDWGKVMETKTYVNDQATGIWRMYQIDGYLYKECNLINNLQNGTYKMFNKNGILTEIGEMKNSSRVGRYKFYNDTGSLIRTAFYIKNKVEGLDSNFVNDRLYKTHQYKNGKREGEFQYFENGEVIHKGLYNNDTILPFSEYLDSIQLDKFGYLKLGLYQEMPSYPGGEHKMMNFISQNVVYPQKAIEEGIEGRVLLKFTVTTTGNIKDIMLISDPIYNGLDKAAVDVFNKMPLWKAGTYKGNPVSVYYILPVKFRLN